MTNDGRNRTATSLPMMIEMIDSFSCWLKEFYLNEIDSKKQQQQLNIFNEKRETREEKQRRK